MKQNDRDGMPAENAVANLARKNRPIIVEGVLRLRELAEYLKSMNLSMFVSLSENGTKITGKIEYSPKINRIVSHVLYFRRVKSLECQPH